MTFHSTLKRSYLITIVLFTLLFNFYNLVYAECPCDIYAADKNPCVAAYSTVRVLSSTYTGPLYQVRRTSDKQIKDIYAIAGAGIANAAAQDSFLGTSAGTVSKIYDQSGKGNHLIKAPKGCYQCPNGSACQDDNESDAKGRTVTIAGRKAYALYMKEKDGYRNNNATDMPVTLEGQGIYMVADGKRYGTACCWDFGNASKDNCYGTTGIMTALYFGTGFWGKGAGNGPWFQADLEGGVWSGGSGGSGVRNNNLPSSNYEFAFGILKSSSTTNESQYAIKVANVQSGGLTTAYDGKAPKLLKIQGGIILGIGGDNSNSSSGTLFEGIITKGRPTNTADTLILKNVQAAGYGSTKVPTLSRKVNSTAGAPTLSIHYIPGSSDAFINYSLETSRSVHLNIFNQQGRQVATIVNGALPTGHHQTAWNVTSVPAGIYVARMILDNRDEWSGKVNIGK
jgi:hypothetical protein